MSYLSFEPREVEFALRRTSVVRVLEGSCVELGRKPLGRGYGPGFTEVVVVPLLVIVTHVHWSSGGDERE